MILLGFLYRLYWLQVDKNENALFPSCPSECGHFHIIGISRNLSSRQESTCQVEPYGYAKLTITSTILFGNYGSNIRIQYSDVYVSADIDYCLLIAYSFTVWFLWSH